MERKIFMGIAIAIAVGGLFLALEAGDFTIFYGFAVFGVFVYLLFTFITYCQKYTNEQEQKARELRRTDKICFAVVGLQHLGPRSQKRAQRLKPYTDVVLEVDNENEFDPNAVRVMTEDGYLIGYVPAKYARKMRWILEGENKWATIDRIDEEKDEDGKWQLRMYAYKNYKVYRNGLAYQESEDEE